MPFRCIVPVLAFLLLAGCASVPPPAPAAEPFCRVGSLAFHTDFETAALHGCAAGDQGPVLTVAPEFAPINPSPWYAWRVSSESAAVSTAGPASAGKAATITVHQRYLHGRHRYPPWTSEDGERWSRLPDEAIRKRQDGSVELLLRIPAGGLYVAAQPPLDHAQMQAWSDGLAGRYGLDGRVIARSVGDRAIYAYTSPTAGRSGSVVLTGRQHPPEVTGGQAFKDFAERLLRDDELAQRFRERFAIGLVPEINPDGVIRGHWRSNRNGVDLNRDWGPFTQPETRGVAEWMAGWHAQVPLRLFIDFHSTWEDVFYVPHPADDPVPEGFAAEWLRRLETRLGAEMPGWSGQHNPGLPTAKSWVRKAYGITAMTYEVGDATPRDAIRRKAEAAAEEMMKLLLETEDRGP